MQILISNVLPKSQVQTFLKTTTESAHHIRSAKCYTTRRTYLVLGDDGEKEALEVSALTGVQWNKLEAKLYIVSVVLSFPLWLHILHKILRPPFCWKSNRVAFILKLQSFTMTKLLKHSTTKKCHYVKETSGRPKIQIQMRRGGVQRK